jgi:hypothetical protein
MITSGTNGFELMGANIIYHMIKIILKLYEYDSTWSMILNNTRIIFLPNVNSFGVYNRKSGEIISEGEDQEIRVDPLRDFNFQPLNKCFQSNTAKIIGRLFKDNLIFGILNFGNKTIPSLLSPWSHFKIPIEIQKTMDLKFFQRSMMRMVKTSLYEKMTAYDEKYSLELEVGNEIQGEGNLEDWAMGASTFTSFVDQNCLEANSPYNENFLSIDGKSNKAFAVRLNHGFATNKKHQMLGNYEAVFMKDGLESQNGLVPRNIHMVKQFIEIIQPSFYIRTIWSSNSEQFSAEKRILSLTVSISGCLGVSHFKMINPIPLTQNIENLAENKAGTSISLEYQVTLTFPKTSEIFTSPVDLIMEIQCDQDFLIESDELGKPISHVLQMRQPESLEVRKDSWVYKNKPLHHLYVRNMNIDKMSNFLNTLSFQSKFNEVQYIYTKEFAIKINNKTEFIVKYERGFQLTVVPVENSNLGLDSNSDLTFFFYMHSSYVYLNKDNSVLKPNWKELTQTPEQDNQQTKQSTYPKDQIIGFTIKLNELKMVSSTVMGSLLGNRVLIESKGKPFEKANQGIVTIKEGDTPETQFSGLLVNSSGVSCRSDSIFSAGKYSQDITFYKLYIKKKREAVAIVLEVQMGSAPSSLNFKWKQKTVELFQKEVNAEGNRVYQEEVERSKYPIIGNYVTIEDPNGQEIIRCYPEKSLNASHATSVEEVRKEFWDAREEKKQVIELEFQNSTSQSYLLWVLLAVALVVSGIGFWVFKTFVMGTKKKDDLATELEEIEEVDNDNDDQENQSPEKKEDVEA